MSLIADALKAAQREKSLRTGTPAPARAADRTPNADRPTDPHPARPGAATGGTYNYFPIRAAAQKRRPADGFPKPVLIGAAIGGAAILLLSGWMLFSPKAAYRPVATPAPVATAPFVDTVETITASADTAVDASAGSEDPVNDIEPSSSVDEPSTIERAPPVRRASSASRPPRSSPTVSATDPSRSTNPNITGRAPVVAGSSGLQIRMDRPPPAQSSASLFHDALEAQKRREYARALDLYGRALETNPGNAETYNNIGAIHRTLGDLEQAERAYRRAVQINPQLAVAWSNLGIVLGQRGQSREAMSALQEAIRMDPANLDTRVNLAIQYDAAGQWGEAKLLLEGVVRSEPGLAEAHYALARIHERLGERIPAIREYTLFLSTAGGRFPSLEEPVRRKLRQLEAR